MQRVKSRRRAPGSSLPAPAPTTLSKSSTSTSGLFSITNTDTIMSLTRRETLGLRATGLTVAPRPQLLAGKPFTPCDSQLSLGSVAGQTHSTHARQSNPAEQIWWVEARWWKRHDPRMVFCLDASKCFCFIEEDAGYLYRSHISTLYPSKYLSGEQMLLSNRSRKWSGHSNHTIFPGYQGRHQSHRCMVCICFKLNVFPKFDCFWFLNKIIEVMLLCFVFVIYFPPVWKSTL